MTDPPKAPSSPLVDPIVLSSTFAFEAARDMLAAAVEPCSASLYTRWPNPTLEHVESDLAPSGIGPGLLRLAVGVKPVDTL